MARKLSPGTHNVRVNGTMRRVRVKANGQWQFLKGGGKPSKTASKKPGKSGGGRKGGNTMAKKKGNGGRKRQGVFSWAVNVITMGMALSDVLVRGVEATQQAPGSKLKYFFNRMIKDYTGIQLDSTTWVYQGWSAMNMARGYAPVGGAIAFHGGMSYIRKKAPVQSVIPALRA